MKKISLIPILAVITTPAFADIAVNAVNPSCTEPTIGSTINEANLQAEWNANTINLEWYDGDTKITPVNSSANTCTYDDEIVVPTNTMTKEGYTFTGWRVRARAAAPQCNLSTWDYGTVPNFDEQHVQYVELYSDITMGDTTGLESEQWRIIFGNGTVVGESTCSSVSGSYATPGDPNNGGSGRSSKCWCKVNSYTPTGASEACDVSTSSSWLYYANFGDDRDGAMGCAFYCTSSCVSYILEYAFFRSAVFGQSN